MNIRPWISLLLLFMVGCTTATATPTPTLTPRPTPTLPKPSVKVTHTPDPEVVARAYLDAWKADDFSAMYADLTADSQGAISGDEFANHHLDVVRIAAVEGGKVDYEIFSLTRNPREALVKYRVVLSSMLFGDIEREPQMTLEMEDGQWHVVWDEALILPELAGGNVLRRVPLAPERGDIYDRNGEPLVAFSDAFALGIVPVNIDSDNEANMLTQLARATGFTAEYIHSLYVDFGPDADFYVPFTDVSAERLNPFFGSVSGYDAVVINDFSGRYYFDTGVAPQVVGYTSAIQPEEVDFYSRKGYWWTERVPRDGIELWAEPFLGGERGGALYLDSPDGNLLSIIGEKPSEPSDTIYTTLDKDLQVQAQKAIFGFKGAIVVLERDTGRVLAMVSAPGFNPNLFEPTNYNSLWVSPLNDPESPLFNRTIRGQYPLGSVFKIITMAAALESEFFAADTVYDCQHEFTELGNPILYDWTYADEKPPSGELTLPEGLMRSCNPYFWHIGVKLFDEGLGNAVPDMARGFGLGSPTGIVGQLNEKPGWVPEEPREKLEATNIMIGQGDLLVTPLQVAMFAAAVGNGGNLYRPQVIARIEDQNGVVTNAFEPELIGTLPISQDALETIQEGMRMVIRDSRGTAYNMLGAFPIEIAGKTGTAEVSGGLSPHAWFVAYSDEGREDLADIVVVAVVENVGEGADFAAPIVRRVLEVYFLGSPRSIYPWEVRIGVPQSLIPEVEEEEEN